MTLARSHQPAEQSQQERGRLYRVTGISWLSKVTYHTQPHQKIDGALPNVVTEVSEMVSEVAKTEEVTSKIARGL